MSFRRSTASTIEPAPMDPMTSGTSSTRPTRPTAAAEWVRSNTWMKTAVTVNCRPVCDTRLAAHRILKSREARSGERSTASPRMVRPIRAALDPGPTGMGASASESGTGGRASVRSGSAMAASLAAGLAPLVLEEMQYKGEGFFKAMGRGRAALPEGEVEGGDEAVLRGGGVADGRRDARGEESLRRLGGGRDRRPDGPGRRGGGVEGRRRGQGVATSPHA